MWSRRISSLVVLLTVLKEAEAAPPDYFTLTGDCTWILSHSDCECSATDTFQGQPLPSHDTVEDAQAYAVDGCPTKTFQYSSTNPSLATRCCAVVNDACAGSGTNPDWDVWYYHCEAPLIQCSGDFVEFAVDKTCEITGDILNSYHFSYNNQAKGTVLEDQAACENFCRGEAGCHFYYFKDDPAATTPGFRWECILFNSCSKLSSKPKGKVFQKAYHSVRLDGFRTCTTSQDPVPGAAGSNSLQQCAAYCSELGKNYLIRNSNDECKCSDCDGSIDPDASQEYFLYKLLSEARCAWTVPVFGKVPAMNIAVYDGVSLDECKAMCNADPACASIDFTVDAELKCRLNSCSPGDPDCPELKQDGKQFMQCKAIYEQTKGVAYCQDGHHIVTEAECKLAAGLLGLVWGSAMSEAGKHKYCRYEGGRAFYNLASPTQSSLAPTVVSLCKANMLSTGDLISLGSWNTDYLRRNQDTTITGTDVILRPDIVSSRWTVEVVTGLTIRLRSWNNDYLYRSGDTTVLGTYASSKNLIGNQWNVEVVSPKQIRLRSWNNDYLHRGSVVTSRDTYVVSGANEAANEWTIEHQQACIERQEVLTESIMNGYCGHMTSYDPDRSPSAKVCDADVAYTPNIRKALANGMFGLKADPTLDRGCNADCLFDADTPSSQSYKWIREKNCWQRDSTYVCTNGQNVAMHTEFEAALSRFAQLCPATTCPQMYPSCSLGGDCVIDACSDGACAHSRSLAPGPHTQPMGIFNYIWGVDGKGSRCTGDYEADFYTVVDTVDSCTDIPGCDWIMDDWGSCLAHASVFWPGEAYQSAYCNAQQIPGCHYNPNGPKGLITMNTCGSPLPEDGGRCSTHNCVCKCSIATTPEACKTGPTAGYFGYTYGQITVVHHLSGLHACKAICESHPECGVFEYFTDLETCHLKCPVGIDCESSVNGATIRVSDTSGRTCGPTTCQVATLAASEACVHITGNYVTSDYMTVAIAQTGCSVFMFSPSQGQVWSIVAVGNALTIPDPAQPSYGIANQTASGWEFTWNDGTGFKEAGNYLGCFSTSLGAVTRQDYNGNGGGATWAECLDQSRTEGFSWFALGSPSLYSTPGVATCLYGGDFTQEEQVVNAKCEEAYDSDGHRLGGNEKIAVYRVHEAGAYHYAPLGADSCDVGDSASIVECASAAQSLGISMSTMIKVGQGGTCRDNDWGGAPAGCSVQQGTRPQLRYKYGEAPAQGCVQSMYQLVCTGKGFPDWLVRTSECAIEYCNHYKDLQKRFCCSSGVAMETLSNGLRSCTEEATCSKDNTAQVALCIAHVRSDLSLTNPNRVKHGVFSAACDKTVTTTTAVTSASTVEVPKPKKFRGELKMRVSRREKFLKETNLISVLTDMIAKLFEVTRSWVHNVTCAPTSKSTRLLSDMVVVNYTQRRFLSSDGSGEVEVDWTIEIPPEEGENIVVTVYAEQFNAKAISEVTETVNTFVNSGALGENYDVNVTWLYVIPEDEPPVEAKTSDEGTNPIIYVIAGLGVLSGFFIVGLVLAYWYYGIRSKGKAPKRKLNSQVLRAGVKGGGAMAACTLQELLSPPAEISAKNGKDLRNMVRSMCDNASLSTCKVFLTYAPGKRDGDAKGYGPGSFYAAAVTKVLHDEGVWCFSDLMLPDGYPKDTFDLELSNSTSAEVLVVVQTGGLYHARENLTQIYLGQQLKLKVIPLRFEDNLPKAEDTWTSVTRDDLEGMLMVSAVHSVYMKLNSIPSPPYTVPTQPFILKDFVQDLRRDVMLENGKVAEDIEDNNLSSGNNAKVSQMQQEVAEDSKKLLDHVDEGIIYGNSNVEIETVQKEPPQAEKALAKYASVGSIGVRPRNTPTDSVTPDMVAAMKRGFDSKENSMKGTRSEPLGKQRDRARSAPPKSAKSAEEPRSKHRSDVTGARSQESKSSSVTRQDSYKKKPSSDTAGSGSSRRRERGDARGSTGSKSRSKSEDITGKRRTKKAPSSDSSSSPRKIISAGMV